ncbi:MAG: archaemetzincin family Zn-dependent metalloprotease [Bacteroidales bacterium]|jgi:archaemetzincin|nr:archaemetzincin family Zn-dependent metalloprotease [Bacteroidales bacterium]
MNQQSISLISFGYFQKDFLEKIAEDVRHEFLFQVHVREGRLDLSDFYDPSRKQYNGNSMLKHVDAIFSSDDVKTMGLFSVDLFIPILTYIFGQAFLNGRTGIASLYRLSNERYGMVMNERVMLERFSKEVIHELGHTFGLVHCHNPTCVMQSVTYVEEIDQKSQHLCNHCRKQSGLY